MEASPAERTAPEPGEKQRGTVVVVNPQGLHMRPASAFAAKAQTFPGSVSVWKDGQCVNGKSLIDLLMLAAEPGTELVVELHGDDAEAALPGLMEILASPSAEEIDGG